MGAVEGHSLYICLLVLLSILWGVAFIGLKLVLLRGILSKAAMCYSPSDVNSSRPSKITCSWGDPPKLLLFRMFHLATGNAQCHAFSSLS